MSQDELLFRTVPVDIVSTLERQCEELPDPRELRTSEAFMGAAVQAMSIAVNIGKVTAGFVERNKNGYTKRNAPAVGLFVRAIKFYEAFVRETASRRGDIAWVHVRPVIEAYVQCVYLMRQSASSAKSFIRTSLRAEKDMLARIRSNMQGRRAWPIERRMLRSIRNYLRMAGWTEAELAANREWRLDGKDMRKLMEAIGLGDSYGFLYGNGSHYVHGTWIDLFMHHLFRVGRAYYPLVVNEEPDPRVSPALSGLVMDLVMLFLRRYPSSIARFVKPIIGRIKRYFVGLGDEVELFIQRRR